MCRKTFLSIVFAVNVLILSNVSFCQINLEWQRRNDYRLSGAEYNPSSYCTAIDSSGGSYLSSLISDSNKVKILLVKYNTSGELEWRRFYQNNAAGMTGNYGCFMKCDGSNIYVASRYKDSTYGNRILLLKYDSTGSIVWENKYHYPGSYGDITGGIALDKSGFIYLTGNTIDVYDNGKCIVLKYKPNGDLVWVRSFQGYSTGNDIVVDEQSNSYIAGSIFSSSYGKTLMMAAKYDSSGVLMWTKSYGLNTPGYDNASVIVLDDSNNVIVGGTSYYNDWNCTTLKYRNDGTLVKYTSYMQGFNRVKSITTDSRCNIYITGLNGYNLTSILIKYDAMLAYKGAVNVTDYSIRTVKFAGGKYLYAAGNKSYTSPSRKGLYFAKLDTNLATINSIDFPVDSSLSVVPYSIVNDKNGNIFLGSSAEYELSGYPYTNFSYPILFKLSQVTKIQNISGSLVMNYSLGQNYPNPFNPKTVIRFQVTGNNNVSIKIFDINGREVQMLVNEKLQAGSYLTEWNASAYPSGVYFYRMVVRHGGSSTADFSETKRMILVR